ncbi:MAG: iron-containing alcohol dehydrogenase, partial [Spirochaetia bacterium]
MQLFHAIVPKIVFGPGRLEELGGMMGEIGKKVFLAIDPFLVTTGLNDRITKLLTAEGIEVEEFSRIE